MAENQNKTISLSPEDLQNIIKTSMEAIAQSQNNRSVPQQDYTNLATANAKDQQRLQDSLEFNRRLTKGKRVPITLPVSLSEYFGSSVTVSVNGNTVKVPVDGNTYYVSEPLANLIHKKINYNNKQLRRVKRMNNNRLFGDVTGDIENIRL